MIYLILFAVLEFGMILWLWSESKNKAFKFRQQKNLRADDKEWNDTRVSSLIKAHEIRLEDQRLAHREIKARQTKYYRDKLSHKDKQVKQLIRIIKRSK